MPGSLVLQIRGTDSWKANTVISQLHFELLAQTEALHRCWSLSRWAVLKEITGHTKPSPLLSLSAHKNEVRGADISWKIVLHTCIRAPFQRKLLLPRKLFQKPHRNPLSSVCGFSHESNIKKPEPKRMRDLTPGIISCMWFFSCFPLTEVIYLMVGAQKFPWVTQHLPKTYKTLSIPRAPPRALYNHYYTLVVITLAQHYEFSFSVHNV